MFDVFATCNSAVKSDKSYQLQCISPTMCILSEQSGNRHSNCKQEPDLK